MTDFVPESILIRVFGKGITVLLNKGRLKICGYQSEYSWGKIDIRELYLPTVDC